MFENKIMGMYFTIKKCEIHPCLVFYDVLYFFLLSISVNLDNTYAQPGNRTKHTDKYTGFFPPRKYEKQNHPKNRETEDRYFGV